MKRFMQIVQIGLILSLAFTFWSCKDNVKSTKVGNPAKVLATAGGVEITNGDIQEMFAPRWKGYVDNYTKSAKKQKISKNEINDHLQTMRERLVSYCLDMAAQKIAYEAFFSDKDLALDEAEYQNRIKQLIFFVDAKDEADMFDKFYKENYMTKEDVLEQCRVQTLMNDYLLKLATESENEALVSTDEAVEEYYNQRIEEFTRPRSVDLQVITINFDNADEMEEGENANKAGRDEDGAHALADEIVAKLNSGEDFNKLAKKYSATWDKETKALFQANFTKFSRMFLPAEESEKLVALNEGEVSEVIANPTSNQLYIFKAENVKEEVVLPLDILKKSLKTALTMQNPEARPIIETISDAMREYEVVRVKEEAEEVATPEEEHNHDHEHDHNHDTDHDHAH